MYLGPSVQDFGRDRHPDRTGFFTIAR